MKPVFLVVALSAALPFASAADEPRPPHVASPEAPVPQLPYRSVFADALTGVEERLTDWRGANAEVAQFPRGHIDLLKWEEAQTGRPSAGEQPGTAPAAPLLQGQQDHHGH